MAAGAATRIAVRPPEASDSDRASVIPVAFRSPPAPAEEALRKVVAVAVVVEDAQGTRAGMAREGADVGVDDGDDDVATTAASAAVVDAVVVVVDPAAAASTRSQLGLQNLEFRWRFRLLCMCVL